MKTTTQPDRALSSLDGMGRAQMPAELRERIAAALATRGKRTIMLGRPLVLMLAAGLALLVGFNVYTLAQSRDEGPKTAAVKAANPVADEYFSPAPSI